MNPRTCVGGENFLRELFPDVPPRTEYSLTNFGKTLLPHVEALMNWGKDNFEQIMINRRTISEMKKFDDIKSKFEQLRNPEKANQMSAYMRDQFRFYGIPTPKRRSLYKNILREEKNNKQVDWELLEACWQKDEREFQYFVLDYLDSMQEYLSFEDIPGIERYVRSKQWWDTIDALDMIIGKLGLNDSRVEDLMLNWSTDEDFWVRRIAIDHQLCRKDKTNTKLLEKIIVNNLGSDEFFINKAIGWSLRDYSKTNPEWVRNFIERYRDKMASLSIREASKYI